MKFWIRINGLQEGPMEIDQMKQYNITPTTFVWCAGMKDCVTYQEMISAMLDGELTSAQQRDLEEHLALCPECRAMHAAFLSLSEAIKGEYSVINIHKPPRYQRKTSDAVCDGTLIAQNALSLSKAISKCTNEPARKKNINRANLISFMIGGVCAALMAVIMCIDNSKGVLGILNSHPYIAFSIAIIVGTIPAIINAIKEYTRK